MVVSVLSQREAGRQAGRSIYNINQVEAGSSNMFSVTFSWGWRLMCHVVPAIHLFLIPHRPVHPYWMDYVPYFFPLGSINIAPLHTIPYLTLAYYTRTVYRISGVACAVHCLVVIVPRSLEYFPTSISLQSSYVLGDSCLPIHHTYNPLLA